MNLKFRKAVFEDLEDIIALCNECFDENTSIEYATDMWNKTKNDENQIYLVGTMDDKIIAHTKITIIPTIFEGMNSFAILNHVCVKPEYRRHNIASKMLVECERISKEKGCIALELWSKNFRQPAHACYLNYGFEVMDAKFFTKSIN